MGMEMKERTLVLLVLAVFLVMIGMAIGESRPRFEQIYYEDHYKNPFGSTMVPQAFYVWHDKESGQEIVCAIGYSANPISCWPTGRNWK